MATKNQHKLARRIIDVVKKHGRINKFDLMDEVGISISTYEKIKPWLERRFYEFIKYEKSTKEWVSMENEFDDV